MANSRGTSLAFLLVTLTVACDGSPTAPTPITPEPTTPVWTDITVKVMLPYPEDAESVIPGGAPGIQGVRVACLTGCQGQPTETTDGEGKVTFKEVTLPLTVRAEKTGHIAREVQLSFGYYRLVLSHEWPTDPGIGEVVRQLGLGGAIASGEILLNWGDDVYVPEVALAAGNPYIGGLYRCPVIIVRNYPSRRQHMVQILAHEAMHAWQRRNGTNPPCGEWSRSQSGQDWVAALEKDLEEHGPIPQFDDMDYDGKGTLLMEIPAESHAMFYSRWTRLNRPPGSEELNRNLCTLAPNRCRNMEDYFGPRPR